VIRILFTLILWLGSLCMVDIDVRWSDGLHIHLPGWVGAISRARKAKLGREEEVHDDSK
jgi:hypothetical protein